ncbi:MAG: hypothetical protein DMG09_18495 [Acidobacteria bacterium]|nr:MAG: hypothetical protein DMG09_18495 [Acidobacteriota bacterium]
MPPRASFVAVQNAKSDFTVVSITNSVSAEGCGWRSPSGRGAKIMGKRKTIGEHRSGCRRESLMADGAPQEPATTATFLNRNASKRQARASFGIQCA